MQVSIFAKAGRAINACASLHDTAPGETGTSRNEERVSSAERVLDLMYVGLFAYRYCISITYSILAFKQP